MRYEDKYKSCKRCLSPFFSYGAPKSDKNLQSVFNIKKPYKNPRDPIAYPTLDNLFLNPDYSQHLSENYGKAKRLKEERLNSD